MDYFGTDVTVMLAATRSMGIGWQGKLPWHGQLKKESQYFHRVTSRSSKPALNAVIMGRRSWDATTVRPMQNRINVIVTRHAERVKEDMKMRHISDELVHVVNSFDEAIDTLHHKYSRGMEDDVLDMAARNGLERVRLGKIFLIGGGELCSTVLANSQITRVLLTLVDAEYTCDAFLSPVFTETHAVGWRRQGAEELDRWVGEAVPRGSQREDGVKYEFMMFEREESDGESPS